MKASIVAYHCRILRIKLVAKNNFKWSMSKAAQNGRQSKYGFLVF
jgi:hypothetical protein